MSHESKRLNRPINSWLCLWELCYSHCRRRIHTCNSTQSVLMSQYRCIKASRAPLTWCPHHICKSAAVSWHCHQRLPGRKLLPCNRLFQHQRHSRDSDNWCRYNDGTSTRCVIMFVTIWLVDLRLGIARYLQACLHTSGSHWFTQCTHTHTHCQFVPELDFKWSIWLSDHNAVLTMVLACHHVTICLLAIL